MEEKVRREVLEEMVKLSTMIEEEETDCWNKMGRIKNDAYINGSHSGYGHALRDMRQWIDRIKMANGRVKVECHKTVDIFAGLW
jgi:site-specific recombinase